MAVQVQLSHDSTWFSVMGSDRPRPSRKEKSWQCLTVDSTDSWANKILNQLPHILFYWRQKTLGYLDN